jgi:hypothetical protein
MNLFSFCENNALSKLDPDGCVGVDPSRWFAMMELYYEIADDNKGINPETAASALVVYEWAKAQLNKACIANEVRGIYAGGMTTGESGFLIPEMAGLGGAVIGGAVIGVGAGLVISYVVDQTSKELGTMMKVQTDANNAVIDYWSDSDSKFE